MKQHSLFCLKSSVIVEVGRVVNLSTTERDWLSRLDVEVTPCCNCKVAWLKPGDEGYARARARREVVQDTLDWVLDRRRGEHPLGGRDALEARLEIWKATERVKDGVDPREDGEVIRIDFKNRRRII